jgi:hypothetical protein
MLLHIGQAYPEPLEVRAPVASPVRPGVRLTGTRSFGGVGMISDAEARYFAEIVDDCQRILGSGVEVVDVGRSEVGSPAEVRLYVRYRLAGTERQSEGRGETVVAAHAELRSRLVVDRLRYGFASFVERG